MPSEALPTKLQRQRILMLVPDADLGVLPEVDSLFDLGYSPQVVQGNVTRERLFQVIRNREFDIIHYAGHATREGILLSDGIFDAASIVQVARACGATLVFLNGCETAEIGQFLVDEHVGVALCTLRGINDALARETAQLFYQALARTGDVRAAYNMSKPPVKGGYTMLTNGHDDRSLAPILEKLIVFEKFITRNDAEHASLQQEILRSKNWFLRVSLAGMVVVGIVIGLATFVAGQLYR